MTAKEKIRALPELQIICDSLRQKGSSVVFTNGCFDILHVGHIRYLEAASRLGDLLVVGVNTDRSVQVIKGPLRPIVPEGQRSELVAALHCVDYVVLFDTPDPLPLIESLQPDVLVKGADWPIEEIVGADLVQRRGGIVAQIPLMPDTSTSIIVERILARFGR
jgi:rfaE bifunctional protein nucleotidyltransferase chain/domain